MNRQETGSDARFSVGRLIGIGLITRLFIDTGVQVFFPFLPLLAEGMGVSTMTLGRLLSLRSLMGLLSPLFGVLADRRGYRHVMRLGLFSAALGYFLLGISTNLWMVGAGMMLGGMGSFAFLPTLQAYLSARLPYHRRARGLGIVEYAWALSGIIGLFLVGQLIAVTSWRAPLFIISGSLFLAFLFYRFLPATRPHRSAAEDSWPDASKKRSRIGQLKRFLDLGPNRSSAWSALAGGALIMFAAMHLFISYGSWFFREYGFGPVQLGSVALVLGIADLCGSVLVSLISDRIGKRRSVLWGTGVAVVGFTLLPLFNTSVVSAMVGLVWVRASFEFAVVSNIPLLSEQVPEQRGKMMSLATATSFFGTSVAGMSGPWAYEHYGVWGLGIIPAISLSLAFMVVLWKVKEIADEPA